MAASTYGVGQYVASEAHVALYGRHLPPGRRAALSASGSHSLARHLWSSAAAVDRDRNALIAEFQPFFSLDMGQTLSQGTYGNSTAQTRLGQLKTFVQGTSSPIAVAAGAVDLIAGSGGMLAALNWARANPTLVRRIVGLNPAVDLQDVYEHRTSDTDYPASAITQLEMRTAYGGSVPTYSTHNPSASGNQTALADIDMLLVYSTNDDYIPVATIEAYRDLVNAAGGSCTIQSVGAQGHSITGLDPREIVNFLL